MHILTALTLWRDRLAAQLIDLPDRALARLADDLRATLTAVEAERQQRRAAYRADAESARLFKTEDSRTHKRN